MERGLTEALRLAEAERVILMMRSLFAGVSGVKTHQIRMDVIANNIANVNTPGYKASRVSFQEMLNQSIAEASAPRDSVGGTNPASVGLGVSLGAVDVMHIQGSVQNTNRPTDLALQGDGYFIVSQGQNQYYTRAGMFSVDSRGALVNAEGMRLMGWQADQNGAIDTTSAPKVLTVPKNTTMPAQATSNLVFNGNLDGRSGAEPRVITCQVYDSLGQAHTLELTFTAGANVNDWNVTAKLLDSGASLDWDSGAAAHTLQFDDQGQLTGGDTAKMTILGTTLGGNVADLGLTFDFSALTQYAEASTVYMDTQDGYAAGQLESFAVDSSGVITGRFSNGLRQSLGQIAIARFTSPEGLKRVGRTLFAQSNNSGDPKVGPAGVAGSAEITAGALEMSNVDLSNEFTNMIVTQRGFQANSRVITASDEMLQELVNLKR